MKKSELIQIIKETLGDLKVNDKLILNPKEDKIKLANAFWRKGTTVKVVTKPKRSDEKIQVRLPNGTDVDVNREDLDLIREVVEECLSEIRR